MIEPEMLRRVAAALRTVHDGPVIPGTFDSSDLAQLTGFVQDSGEGRWTLVESIDRAVPMPV